MSDILISEYMQGVAVDALGREFDLLYLPELWKDPAQLREQVRRVRGLIVRNQTRVDAALLHAAERLRVVGRAGVGLDNIDLEAATVRGVLVTSTPDQNAISVAELALGMMLSLARMIPQADADTKAGHWSRQRFLGTELFGKTLGIVGFGKIGWLTARRAHAFGMRILATDPYLSPDAVLLRDLQGELMPLDMLLREADVVSCHLPATPSTRRLFGAEQFATMKPTAWFVNTSRGEVVDEAALLKAARDGVIAAAALDVRVTEPPAAGELERLPNVLLMPHVGALTREAQQRVTAAVCSDVGRVLRGEPAMHAVNRVSPAEGQPHPER